MAITQSSPDALRALIRRFAAVGRIDAIVLRPARGEVAISVNEARAEPGFGLIGDRRAERRRDGDAARKREITLMQAEHLPIVAGWCGLNEIDVRQPRRNLVVSGLNLLSMRSLFRDLTLHWHVGDSAVIEVTGSCEPCSKMESEIGYGAYNALRGHGGLTGRVIVAGTIRVGDRMQLAPEWVQSMAERAQHLCETSPRPTSEE